MLIYLIGYMGSGKTTISRMLARRMRMEFADMDAEIVGAAGKSVGEIFAEKGEEEFRRLENKALAKVAKCENAVIATGGGTPCFFDNMEVMNATGLTIYLKMSPEKLATRLERSKNKRPLIMNKDQKELVGFIAENLEKREPFYSKAKLIIDGDRASDQYIAEHIGIYLDNYEKGR